MRRVWLGLHGELSVQRHCEEWQRREQPRGQVSVGRSVDTIILPDQMLYMS